MIRYRIPEGPVRRRLKKIVRLDKSMSPIIEWTLKDDLREWEIDEVVEKVKEHQDDDHQIGDATVYWGQKFGREFVPLEIVMRDTHDIPSDAYDALEEYYDKDYEGRGDI